MDLILWRHADAQDAELAMPDLDRELTAKGREQALRVGQWLNDRMPEEVLVLASPAKRTQQTAAALGRPFKTVDALLPGADPTEILLAAGWPDAKGTVLVVGHQPTMGSTAAYLLYGEVVPQTVKKGGLVWLTNRTRNGEEQVVLKAAMTPEML